MVWTNDGAGENNWVSKEILKFNDVVWHASWSLTGNILAISGGDNKVSQVLSLVSKLIKTLGLILKGESLCNSI